MVERDSYSRPAEPVVEELAMERVTGSRYVGHSESGAIDTAVQRCSFGFIKRLLLELETNGLTRSYLGRLFVRDPIVPLPR